MNHETFNLANNGTNALLRRAERLLCKTHDCHSRLQAWMAHHKGQLRASVAASLSAAAGGGGGGGGLVYTGHSTIDPRVAPWLEPKEGVGGKPDMDFTQFIQVAGGCESGLTCWGRSSRARVLGVWWAAAG